ncbi:DUF4249 domain-containing protein [Halosquirtibacter xylanolyticus]|uniref:DUF4249 family protein n=1 Tax=Halosquirtibacter xylanolyticus TaxID=3374599 RepID=UPI0037480D61|nr:DUF4249 domain-containing protein [Prolixibacteraceae bacterium]
MKNIAYLISSTIWILILTSSCKKDVTNEYVTNEKPQLGLECVFSPKKPWSIYLFETSKFNEQDKQTNEPNVSSVVIIEDGIKEINLTYNTENKCYESDLHPKVGSHYKLIIERPNLPTVTAEDIVPAKLEVEIVDFHFKKKRQHVESNYFIDTYCCDLKIKSHFNSHSSIIIRKSTHRKTAHAFQVKDNYKKELQKRGLSKEMIHLIENVSGNHHFWGGFNDISEYATRDRKIYAPNLSEEKIKAWEEKYGNWINPYIYELQDIIPIVYKMRKDENSKIFSNNIIFSSNKNFVNCLIGNLDHYHGQTLNINFEQYDEDYKCYLDKEDILRRKGWEHYEVKLLISHQSPVLNRYFKNAQIQQNIKSKMFAPIIQVQSNVKNGVGIFAAENTTEAAVYYYKRYY